MKVLIIDDDHLVSTSLKTIIEAEENIYVVGVGSSGVDAIEMYKQLHPDVLLMDIRMNTMTGIEAAEELLKEGKDAKILFLTTFSDEEYIIKAMQIGAKGYILKQNFESIVPALRAVYAGQRVYGDAIMDKIPVYAKEGVKPEASSFGLTDKEFEIIMQVANGLSNKEISECLYLSEGTIRNYISIIFEKLSLRDRTQLAIFYYKNFV
ncbi:MAG: response regulator transcription factor [Eubacteriales bacterium]